MIAPGVLAGGSKELERKAASFRRGGLLRPVNKLLCFALPSGTGVSYGLCFLQKDWRGWL